ncbi:hypothetical protein Syun_025873 [Stephania yunnanensis]|uniref:Uncharacterized protein n=1 Tax=Stephania yunnanensis TaxID=152371 RepID=A0AAP0EZL0_9MAGN
MQIADDTQNSVKEEPIEGDQRLRRSHVEQRRRRRRAQPAAEFELQPSSIGDQAAYGGGAKFELQRRQSNQQCGARSEQRARAKSKQRVVHVEASSDGAAGVRRGGSRLHREQRSRRIGEGGSDATAATNSTAVVARLAVDRAGILERRNGAATAHGQSGDGASGDEDGDRAGGESLANVQREMVLQ